MRGFTTRALILFPKMDSYENKPSVYKFQFRKAVANLLSYLEEMDIQPCVFYTDDVARSLNLENVKYIKTLPISDEFFVKKYCDSMVDVMSVEDNEFEEFIMEAQKKDPGTLDMTVEQRFELVSRHNAAVVKKIIPQFNVVFHFAIPNRAQYKVTSKPDDGRIRVTVNANTFAPTVFFSGKEEDPCDVLAAPYANRTLDNWR